MRIGLLRHRVEIGRYVEGQDPNTGDPTRTWQAVATVWASVEGLAGQTFFQAQQTVERSDHRVTIRYRQGVEPAMRIRHAGRELEIQSVLDVDGRRRWLTLICRLVRPA